MAFEIGIDSAQCKQMLTTDVTELRPRRVEYRRRVSLGENKLVVCRIPGVCRIEVHYRKKQAGHDFRC